MLANAHGCRAHFLFPTHIDPLKQQMLLHTLRMVNSQEIAGPIAVLLILLTGMIQGNDTEVAAPVEGIEQTQTHPLRLPREA